MACIIPPARRQTKHDYRSLPAFFGKIRFGHEIRHVYLSQNLENHPRYVERKADEWQDE